MIIGIDSVQYLKYDVFVCLYSRWNKPVVLLTMFLSILVSGSAKQNSGWLNERIFTKTNNIKYCDSAAVHVKEWYLIL